MPSLELRKFYVLFRDPGKRDDFEWQAMVFEFYLAQRQKKIDAAYQLGMLFISLFDFLGKRKRQ